MKAVDSGVTASVEGRPLSWASVGVAAGALYLVVLPAGHITALRSLSLPLVLVAAIVLWLRAGRPWPPLVLVFGVWLGAACLSLLTTHDFPVSVETISAEIIRSLLVFFAFWVLSRESPRAYRAWLLATAVGFAALSALAIASFARHGEWTVYYVPPLGDFATSAVTVLPLLVGYYLFPMRRPVATALVSSAVLLTLVAGFLTFSRAFWLVVLCGPVAGIGAYFWRRGRFGWRTLLLVVCVGAAVAVGLAGGASEERGGPSYFASRFPLYAAAIEKIAHNNPLTGTGYGHETDGAWYLARFPGTRFAHPHNIVLSFLDQMGPLGFVALLAIFGWPAVAFVRAFREGRPEAQVAALCGLVLLASVFVKNSSDYFFIKQNLWLFFAHLGLYFGVIDRASVRG